MPPRSQDHLGINQSTSGDVCVRLSQGLVQCGAIGLIKPVARVKR